MFLDLKLEPVTAADSLGAFENSVRTSQQQKAPLKISHFLDSPQPP